MPPTRSGPPAFAVYDGAADRLAAWRSSSDPVERDRAYAAVLRRQFDADGVPITAARTITVVDVDTGDRL